MKAAIKLLTNEKCTSNGFPVVVKLSEKQKRFKKVVGHSLEAHWNAVTNEPLRAHPDFHNLMPLVLDLRATVGKINLGQYSFDEAKGMLFEKQETAVTFGVLEFFDRMIREKKAMGKPVDSFKGVRDMLEGYLGGRDMSVNDITYNWLKDFMIYKLGNGAKMGGVMSYLRTIRSVYKEAQRTDVDNIKQSNPFIGIIKDVASKEPVQLSVAHLRALKEFEPKPGTTKPNAFKMKRNVAVWLFQFYIGGHDYVDIARLKWSDIKDGRLVFKRFKNRFRKDGGQQINNKLFPEALEVIELYGDKDAERIFSFIPDPDTDYNGYKNFRRNINHSLDRMSATMEMPTITTKSNRYVFRTLAGEKLIHDLIVMLLQGHKNDSISYRYQGLISYEVQDLHHATIIAL